MSYQGLQILQATVCASALFVLGGYAFFSGKRGKSPLVLCGVVVAGVATAAFLYVGFMDATQSELRFEMTARLLRELPAVIIVAYGCSIQAKRYRGARNRRLFRTLFTWVPLVLVCTCSLAWLTGLLYPFPILDLRTPLPSRAAYLDALWMIPLGSFSTASAVVFLEAIRQEVPGLRQKLQNAFAALGMACIGAIAWSTLYVTLLRITATPASFLRQVRMVADVQAALIVAAALGFAVAVIFHGVRDNRVDVAERFLRFVEIVGEISEVFENSPISSTGLSVEYASALEAGGTEFLELSDQDLRRLDSLFRISVLWTSSARPEASARLRHLVEIYAEELNSRDKLHNVEAERASSFKSRADIDMNDRFVIEEAMSCALMLLTTEDNRKTADALRQAPVWAQLCSVALADGAVLASTVCTTVLNGSIVPPRVLNAYWLAKRKVSVVRVGSDLCTRINWDQRDTDRAADDR